MGRKRNPYIILIGKPEYGKVPLRSPKLRWVDIKIDLRLHWVVWTGMIWLMI
jgi:hypothetical protein